MTPTRDLASRVSRYRRQASATNRPGQNVARGAGSGEGEEPDRPASEFLEPGSRWTPLLESISSYYNGAALDLVSTRDLGRYTDTGVNWRVVEGYGGSEARTGCVPERLVQNAGVSACVDG